MSPAWPTTTTTSDAGGPGLVIGYGKAPEHQIADGVARLAAAYRATRTADPVEAD